MAQAIKRIYGDDVKLTIGPAIDKGFYMILMLKKIYLQMILKK